MQVIENSKPGQKLGSFTLASADDFSYKDPIDGRWAHSAVLTFIVLSCKFMGSWTKPEVGLTRLGYANVCVWLVADRVDRHLDVCGRDCCAVE